MDGKPNRGTGRKSTKALELSGALAHDPSKYADRLKEPSKGLRPIGDPPSYFTKAQREAWYEVLNTVHAGTVFEEDRFAVEEFAKIRVELRGSKVSPATYNRFFQFLKLFGLSPADRSRVAVQDNASTEDNPFN